MKVRPKIRSRILREDRLLVILAIDRDRAVRIVLTQREHCVVGRSHRFGEQAQSEEGEEMAVFHAPIITPFRSETHALDLPKVVIILPHLPRF